MAAAALNGAVGSSNSGPAAASGAVLQAAAGMYEQLKGEWNRKSPNLSKCGEELGRLKVRVAEGAMRVVDRAELWPAGETAVRARLRRRSTRVKDPEQPKCGRRGVKKGERPGTDQMRPQGWGRGLKEWF